MKTSKAITKIYEAARSEARGSESGKAHIASKDVAVLIRQTLKRNFPAIKFSVRSDYNSINVYWTDGPTSREVDDLIGCYSFGGFDGMIDMAYSKTNWLTPEGEIEFAETSGTEGSRGSEPAAIGADPKPGWVMVYGGPKYVFTSRETSDEYDHQLAFLAAEYYLGPDACVPLDAQGRVEDFRCEEHREYFRTLMHRYDVAYGLSKPEPSSV